MSTSQRGNEEKGKGRRRRRLKIRRGTRTSWKRMTPFPILILLCSLFSPLRSSSQRSLTHKLWSNLFLPSSGLILVLYRSSWSAAPRTVCLSFSADPTSRCPQLLIVSLVSFVHGAGEKQQDRDLGTSQQQLCSCTCSSSLQIVNVTIILIAMLNPLDITLVLHSCSRSSAMLTP
eukprot:756928-Hanusia_phi.AAC.2